MDLLMELNFNVFKFFNPMYWMFFKIMKNVEYIANIIFGKASFKIELDGFRICMKVFVPIEPVVDKQTMCFEIGNKIFSTFSSLLNEGGLNSFETSSKLYEMLNNGCIFLEKLEEIDTLKKMSDLSQDAYLQYFYNEMIDKKNKELISLQFEYNSSLRNIEFSLETKKAKESLLM